MSEALPSISNRSLSSYSQAVLDERTGGNAHYLKAVRFEHVDHTELTAIKLDSTDSLKRGGGALRKNTDKNDMSYNSLKKSQQRAKKEVRHKCLSINASTMITTTFKENITDFSDAWGVLKYFIKLVRKFYKDFQFVCVPELQKRGAVHFHIACSGHFSYNFLRRLWRKAAGYRGGNIDVSHHKKNGLKRSPIAISKYISKYISKTDSVSFNKKRYSSSRGIFKPEPMRGWLPMCGGAVVYFMTSLVEQMSHNPVSDIFESDDGRYPFIFVST